MSDILTDDGIAGSPPVTPPHRRSSRAGLAVVGVSVVVFVLGTIGPPLFGRGVFLTADLVYLAYPWQAFEDPVTLDVGAHGPTSDTVDSTYPQRAAFADSVRGGDTAGWDPWIGGGGPLAATSSAGVLNPLAWPFLVVPAWFAPALVKLLGLGCAIGFTYLFCRRLGTSRTPALLGGVAFAGSGYLVMWTNWQQADVASLLPALFWATERFLQRRTAASAVPVAIALAGLLLGGFPAVVGYGLYVLVGYVVIRLAVEHRSALGTLLRTGAGVAAALVAGVALVSAVLLPFAARLGDMDTTHREQDAGENLGVENVLTMAVPGAFGISGDGELFRGPGRNQVESVAYVGVVTCLLALAAAALPAGRRAPPGATGAMMAATAVLGVAVFAGGPALAALQRLPVFSDNYVGRALSVLGLTVAVLAALGLQALLDLRGRRLTRPERVRVAVVGGVAAVAGASVMVRSVQWVRPFGGGEVMQRALVLPAILGIVSVAAIAVVWRAVPAGRARSVALAGLPVLLVVQSLALAVPLLPNEDRSLLYPVTPAQEFVTDHVGSDRIAAEGRVFYGDVPMLWKTRTFTGHTFHAPTWKDAIETVDGEAFVGNPSETFPALRATKDVVTSPVLDRLGVAWFATRPDAPPLGTVEPGTLAGASCEPAPAPARAAAAPSPSPPPTARVDAGEAGLRGVTVRVCGDGDAVPYGSRLVVTARTPDAEVTGALHLHDALPQGDVTVSLPGETLAGAGVLEVTVVLEDADVELPLATTPSGDLAVDIVRPTDDGLRLAYAADLRVYERLDALPRIRWASRAEVVPDATDRLAYLSSGQVPDDTVVLSTGQDAGEAVDPGDDASAAISVVEDGGDAMEIHVDAPADGHVVVADALQDDWSANVDGRPADLVDADHAGVAVAVPSGVHEVRLELAPRGRGAASPSAGSPQRASSSRRAGASGVPDAARSASGRRYLATAPGRPHGRSAGDPPRT